MKQENCNKEITNEEEISRIATGVSLISIIGNIALSAFKLLAGLIAHSGAMVSDAVHSASDVISSVVVIIGIRLAAKESDKEHPYGHERLECVAAILLAVLLFSTGLGIGANACRDIFTEKRNELAIPGILALVAAVVSIVTKEAMYWYTRYNAKRIDSGALMADAWHHRSDALSSIGALIGIIGARMGYPIADSLASLVICVFIAKASIEIFMDAVDKMVDHACDEEVENAIKDTVLKEKEVKRIDLLQTRVFGNKIYVDLEIALDGDLNLRESHEIAERVHDSIEKDFPKVKHIMVHVNPFI